MMMKIQYLGHSAFYVEEDKLKAMIDPFFPEPVTHPIYNTQELTHIFLTHGHGDHMGEAVQLAKDSGATIIANYEICLHLEKQGIKCHAMHIGGRTSMDFGCVKMTHALHGSGIVTEMGLVYGGNPGGYVIEAGGKKLYHAGDTGLTMDMQLLESESIDVALLPIGGNFTMDVADALRAVEFIRPSIAIPMHFNTFSLIEADPVTFQNKNHASQSKIMAVGDVFEF
jgi:L-ascorbate metabolism protein UlaG (beta-lactamase superfamily)